MWLRPTSSSSSRALQFLHALARHDDLALGLRAAVERGFAQRQAMAVGGHAAQHLVAQVEEQAVEVIAHVLLRHREGGALDQFLEAGFRHAHALGGFDLVDRREIVGRQAGQREAAAPGLDRDLVARLRDRDLAAIGQGTDDLEQLTGGDRRLAVLRVVDGMARDHLHLQVRTRQRELTIAHLHQQVGENRKGLPAFDDIDDLRQRLQEDFALQAETHAVGFPGSKLWKDG